MAEEDIICNLDGCEIEDDKNNIIACLLCRKTYHMVCANVKTKSSMYVCTDCSKCILQITNIKKDVKNIHQTVIADLRTKVATLTEELKHVKWKSFTDGPQEYVFRDYAVKC